MAFVAANGQLLRSRKAALRRVLRGPLRLGESAVDHHVAISLFVGDDDADFRVGLDSERIRQRDPRVSPVILRSRQKSRRWRKRIESTTDAKTRRTLPIDAAP